MPTPSETTQLKLALIALGFGLPGVVIATAVLVTPLSPSAPTKAEAKAPINEGVSAESSYLRPRERHLEEVYEDNARTKPFLEDVEDLDWVPVSPQPSSENREDLFAKLRRDRARAKLEEPLKSASVNRIEAYEDEEPILTAELMAKWHLNAPLGEEPGSKPKKLPETKTAEQQPLQKQPAKGQPQPSKPVGNSKGLSGLGK